jgi:hypothetical protein
MKKKINSVVLLGFLIVITLYSCKQVESQNNKSLSVKVYNSYETPIITGVGGRIGKRVLLKINKSDEIKFIGIEYNKTLLEASVFKELKDTVWLESYFYDRVEKVKGQEELPIKKDDDYCNLHYSLFGKKKVLKISDFELVLDTVQWK